VNTPTMNRILEDSGRCVLSGVCVAVMLILVFVISGCATELLLEALEEKLEKLNERESGKNDGKIKEESRKLNELICLCNQAISAQDQLLCGDFRIFSKANIKRGSRPLIQMAVGIYRNAVNVLLQLACGGGRKKIKNFRIAAGLVIADLCSFFSGHARYRIRKWIQRQPIKPKPDRTDGHKL
jgi:hypothetical protein